MILTLKTIRSIPTDATGTCWSSKTPNFVEITLRNENVGFFGVHFQTLSLTFYGLVDILPFELISGQHLVQLMFVSDATGTGRGFYIDYTQVCLCRLIRRLLQEFCSLYSGIMYN